MKIIPIVYCKYKLKFPYFVTDTGQIYSKRANKFLSYQKDKDGYAKIQMISTDGKRHRYSVHRLVLENFNPVPNMHQLQVNHIDGNKFNNKLSNLEWCTCIQNIHHAAKMGLRARQYGEHNPMSKVTEEEVKEIIELLLTHQYTSKEIGNIYGLNDDYANRIRRKEAWTYLTKDIDFD